MSQAPKRRDPPIAVDGAMNQLVGEFARVYAEASPEDHLFAAQG